ncbi:MAG: thiosulfate oxidation carrier protein SoxY [Alphaproteobacteria bacterium]|nr:thiosulfate oxidation carrier protein SoxY [Alphaproteobacteria bacterium]
MAPTRRDVLRLGGAAAAAAMFPAGAATASNGVEQAIAAFTRGAMALEAGVRLEVPEIADNGGAVPVRVAAEGARRIALFNDGNPYPGVAVFSFGPLAPPAATIRIRLAGSQNVIAVAELADGTFRKASRAIAVTVGGCA